MAHLLLHRVALLAIFSLWTKSAKGASSIARRTTEDQYRKDHAP
jgi:hypothetical protein